ncbi:efflux RND transporter periplasmic adaptor subunit [Starkeya sp. ORNL1]|uniref:efflux RND transporter periplasmic adaptor subunit n=1 Tax=Starkeya sp. ORNL1 TaxID=2709380 RepID=UPI00146476E1|nr:efflux RND transporter periplasmic adaptor subunit [Starkeya sp. ORNL1]QJP17015.1 efflux RND transporter periplasmic adaptor subunit [Starkeya sp. ORNL1]
MILPVRIRRPAGRPLLLLACILVCACTRGETADQAATEPRAALTVAVATVERQTVRNHILASGSVSPWRELVIGSEASGLAVAEIAVEEGQHVGKGDLLVRLNDAALNAEIAEQNALIDEAAANLASARLELDRAEKLVTTKAISQQTADERATAVKTTEAKLAAAKAVLDQLKVQLARTRILAPDDGYVLKRSVSLGQVVSTGAELVRMVQRSRLEVAASVAEAELLAARAGDDVRVTDPAGRSLTGTVRELAPSVDATSRLGIVRIDLPSDSGLKPGMFVRVEIETEPRIALAVPRQALVWRTGGAGVFVVQTDASVALSPVVTGRQMDDLVEITSGLAENERIVSEGAAFLNDGDKVQVGTAAARASAGPRQASEQSVAVQEVAAQ